MDTGRREVDEAPAAERREVDPGAEEGAAARGAGIRLCGTDARRRRCGGKVDAHGFRHRHKTFRSVRSWLAMLVNAARRAAGVALLMKT